MRSLVLLPDEEDPELWRKAKLQAVREDKTVGRVVGEGLRMRLSEKGERLRNEDSRLT